MNQQSQGYALTMAQEDQTVRVVALRAGRNLDRRLTELGIHIGSELRVVQRQGNALVVSRDNARIAIGAGMAMKILVAPAEITAASNDTGAGEAAAGAWQ
ncbi:MULTISPECIES: FeoA family protein [unclassified Ectothiorhodospira]|uniref:FeoA family protein n=1 Tax=unclassified Ectothiorhodospira TaxID=2684909 RepID=UPI001EE961D2|nr:MULTISPECIES: FeoA family protein [unclassified Ectothiorhodospira]MCG5515450.1 FeoA domain-containing protein [Ectothiorhodospira sp. 9100]MCG5518197.1 FeoA domain-containing protein [Ectothiorhodospira sp. 9905]